MLDSGAIIEKKHRLRRPLTETNAELSLLAPEWPLGSRAANTGLEQSGNSENFLPERGIAAHQVADWCSRLWHSDVGTANRPVEFLREPRGTLGFPFWQGE